MEDTVVFWTTSPNAVDGSPTLMSLRTSEATGWSHPLAGSPAVMVRARGSSPAEAATNTAIVRGNTPPKSWETWPMKNGATVCRVGPPSAHHVCASCLLPRATDRSKRRSPGVKSAFFKFQPHLVAPCPLRAGNGSIVNSRRRRTDPFRDIFCRHASNCFNAENIHQEPLASLKDLLEQMGNLRKNFPERRAEAPIQRIYNSKQRCIGFGVW